MNTCSDNLSRPDSQPQENSVSRTANLLSVLLGLVAWSSSFGQQAAEPLFPVPEISESSEAASWDSSSVAQLQLPSASGIGYLQLPDGRRLRVMEENACDSLTQPNATEPATDAAAAGGSSSTASGTAGQDNGTNPAQNITTFIASNEFYELDGGNEINNTYARLKFPMYDKRGSFLLEVPFVFYDFTATNPTLPEVGGIGDVKFQVSYNTWVSDDKKLTMINFLEMYVPSADTAVVELSPNGNELTAFNLGTGKYVLGPGLGFVYAIKPNFIVAPLYFYEASVAGDDARPDIQRGKLRVFGMYAWDSGLYTLPEFQVLTNYNTGNNDAYVAPEVGYSHRNSTLYVKPGIGIHPDFNDRQSGIEFGARVQF